MVDLPSNVGLGTVTGHIVSAIADTTGDINTYPDQVPASGRVFFTANLASGFAKDPTALLTIIPAVVTVTLDAEGYLADIAGNRQIKLIATNDPDLVPINFTYTVSFDLVGVKIPSFSMSLPEGTTIDLATIVPVGPSTGTALSVAEAAAAAAATSAAIAIAGGGGGGGGVSLEVVYDAIAQSVRGFDLITVTPSDAGDITTISTSATQNSTDAVLLARANHTGTQLAVTISDFTAAVNALITGKASLAGATFTGAVIVPTPTLSTHAATKAYADAIAAAAVSLNSPAFTGTPTAPTPTTLDSTTKLATTAFVATRVDTAANAAPGSALEVKCPGGIQPLRPSARTDISFVWLMLTEPSYSAGYAIDGDKWRAESW